MKKRKFIFTNREYAKKGVMATILGLISCVAIGLAVYLTYKSGGVAPFNYGLAMLLALIFSMVGFVLAIISRVEKDLFYLFSYIGMVINFIAIAAISILLYAGAKGI